MRAIAAAGLAFLVASCAGPSGRQQATCYRILESVVTEAGSRALDQVPCPPGRQGILREES
jgi:hypothetical protein